MDFVLPVRPVPLRLVGGRGHYQTVIREVLTAETSVWIATANLKELMVEGPRRGYRSILGELARMARRKVELRILHAALPSRPFRAEFDRHPVLVKGGLELRQCPRVHMKAIIVDGRFLYLGSANWTGAGLGAKGVGRRNFELGMVTEDEGMLDEVQGIYDRIWRGDECRTCRLRDRCEAPLDTI